MRRRGHAKRRRSYGDKRARQGADNYGVWRDGKRLSPERIAGRVIY